MPFAAVAVALACVVRAGQAAAQDRGDFVPVGVVYKPAADPIRQRMDLEEMRRLHFNVFATVEDRQPAGITLSSIERSLGGAADVRITAASLAVVKVADSAPAEAVTRETWQLFAEGHRGIVFDDWAALERNTGALTAAVEFADHVTGNAALYAPLRPRVPMPDAPDVTVAVDPHGKVSTRFLESADAMVLIVTNAGTGAPTEITMTFSRDIPEAIWQNMLTGAAVNFVAGPDGPTYTKMLPPDGVLVLMIRKRWK